MYRRAFNRDELNVPLVVEKVLNTAVTEDTDIEDSWKDDLRSEHPSYDSCDHTCTRASSIFVGYTP